MDAFLGQILLFPYSHPINNDLRGWLPCKGQTLEISQNQALYSLIGNRFGSTGSSFTFKLPDIPPIQVTKDCKMMYYIAIEGIYPPRP